MRKIFNKKAAFVVLCTMLLGATSASAQSSVTSQATTNYDDQLALDVTPIPAGSGALFVPTLSNPQQESRVVVYFEGEKVTTGLTGERIIVPPGEYELVIGTGTKEMAAKSNVRVVEGSTVVVQPFYGGLELVAVNQRGERIRVNYGVQEGSERVVSGSTSKDEEEPARTYLLSPGPKTLEFGDGTELAFYIPQGKKLTYRAVFDGDRFVELQHSAKPLEVKDKWWRARWTIGADVSFNYSKDMVSDFSGMYGQLGAFSETEIGVDYYDNLLTLKLNIDESWVVVKSDYGAGVPIRSLRDSVKGEFLYAYRLFRVFGPFVRVTAKTSLFETNYYSDEETEFLDQDGASLGSLEKDKAYRVLKPFAPLYLEEAGGINLTVWDGDVFDLVFLGGVAAQQHYFRNGKYISGQEKNQVTLKPLKNEKFYGALAEARMGLRLGQTFRISVTGNMFVPKNQIFNKKKFAPHYGVSGLAEFSINSFASLVYRGEWSRPTNQAPASMFHGASLRLQHNLF